MPLAIRSWISLTVALASAVSCASAGIAPSIARASAPANKRRNAGRDVGYEADRVMAATVSWSVARTASRRAGRGAEGDTRRHALRAACVGLAADDGDHDRVERRIAARLHDAGATDTALGRKPDIDGDDEVAVTCAVVLMQGREDLVAHRLRIGIVDELRVRAAAAAPADRVAVAVADAEAV